MDNYTLEEAIEYINNELEEAYELHAVTESLVLSKNKPDYKYATKVGDAIYKIMDRDFMNFFFRILDHKYGNRAEDYCKGIVSIVPDVYHPKMYSEGLTLIETVDITFDPDIMKPIDMCNVADVCISVVELINKNRNIPVKNKRNIEDRLLGAVHNGSIKCTLLGAKNEIKKDLKDNCLRLVFGVVISNSNDRRFEVYFDKLLKNV